MDAEVGALFISSPRGFAVLLTIPRRLCRSRPFASYIGDLPPETSIAYEIGAKFDLFDGITANIALFDIHKRNVLYTESIGDETVAKTAAACALRAWRWILPGR